ncbi:hypothetical protein [Actinomadura verrucosospora]|uniref:Uncharacterized protein n=1 Tax=Actinomadura verrucosospora TaxID=46165 RepID=A0A7D4A0C9_ACTVE|nr:hypothetical protein [Actinomadura verrucosospora]QKG25026.1 hypothetical protein ACTIVE_6677 [Actinomadura verrucosospora]
MARHWTRIGLAAALACCLAAPSSAARRGPSVVDDATVLQLTAAAGTLVQGRSEALVQRRGRLHPDVPTEVLGVRISPRVARVQARAVHQLENVNRAPVEGGPAYTGARTSLDPRRAVRAGNRITLDAVEHTVVRYGGAGRGGKVTQSVRRRFDFRARGEDIVLVGERVLDPGAQPVNDPAPRSR